MCRIRGEGREVFYSEPAGEVPWSVNVPLIGRRLPLPKTNACLSWTNESGVCRKQLSVSPTSEPFALPGLRHSRYE